MSEIKYTVLKDTREKDGGWTFTPSTNCEGTIIQTLQTGDYTLQGYSKLFVIERKADTGEFAKNIYEKRFERELQRLEEFTHPFMVLEFTMEDIINFPIGSGIPSYRWDKLQITKWFMLKRLLEYELEYKTKIILAGKHGKEVASSIFKRIVEFYEPEEAK